LCNAPLAEHGLFELLKFLNFSYCPAQRLSMQSYQHPGWWVLTASVFLASQTMAQRAPGEDPVKLDSKVVHTGSPFGNSPKSGGLDGNSEMPAWLKAKVARYEAKSFSASADDGTLLTDKDLNTSTSSNTMRRSCTQDLGSTQAPSRPTRAGGNNQQIVVLRGDVVNICR
jgi:hypothetical protein